MDEEALIAAARGGDRSAFEQLMRRNQDRIYWMARQVVGNAEDAKDVTQNVLIRLWRVLPRYDSRWAFSTWIYRVTVNLAIDHLRQVAPRARDTEFDERLIPVDPDRQRGPDEAASDREVEKIFSELNQLLPPQQRAAFALREIEGLTSEEVAEVLDIAPSTVRNHLFQARKTLRRELALRHPEYLPKRGDGGTGR